jgi:excisionase family DNA binding protein
MSTSVVYIPEKRTFRPGEVADILQVSIPTIYRWCESGKLDFVRIGPRLMRIKRECVVKIIRVNGESVDL